MNDFSCINCGELIGDGNVQCSGCKAIVYCGPECQSKDWKAQHSSFCVDLPESKFNHAVQNRWTGLLLGHARLFAEWANALRREYEPKHPDVAQAKAEMHRQLVKWKPQSENTDLLPVMKSYVDKLADFGAALVLHDEQQNAHRHALQNSIALNIERILLPNTNSAIGNHAGSYRHAWSSLIDAMEKFISDDSFDQQQLETVAVKVGQVFWGRVSTTVLTD